MIAKSLLEDIYQSEKVDIITRITKKNVDERGQFDSNMMFCGHFVVEDEHFVHIGPNPNEVSHSVNKDCILVISRSSMQQEEEVVYERGKEPLQ